VGMPVLQFKLNILSLAAVAALVLEVLVGTAKSGKLGAHVLSQFVLADLGLRALGIQHAFAGFWRFCHVTAPCLCERSDVRACEFA
jgi:hypothetical protein